MDKKLFTRKSIILILSAALASAVLGVLVKTWSDGASVKSVKKAALNRATINVEGSPPLVITIINRSLELSFQDGDEKCLITELSDDAKRYMQNISQFMEFLKTNPDQWIALWISVRHNKCGERISRTLFEAARTMGADKSAIASILSNDGYNLLKNGEKLDAYLVATKAHKIDPTCHMAMSLMADIHYSDAEFDDALNWYQKALFMAPEDERWNLLLSIAYTYKSLGDKVSACRNYQEALKSNPQMETSYKMDCEKE